MKRRILLRAVVTGATLTILPITKLLLPASALATTPSREAFEATTESEVLQSLFGVTRAIQNNALKIEVPLQSMYGKDVPIKVWCEMESVESIAIVTRNNRYPLDSVLHLKGAEPYYSTRIRLERNSPIAAYAKAGDSVYFATAEIKFTRGGYGTHLE